MPPSSSEACLFRHVPAGRLAQQVLIEDCGEEPPPARPRAYVHLRSSQCTCSTCLHRCPAHSSCVGRRHVPWALCRWLTHMLARQGICLATNIQSGTNQELGLLTSLSAVVTCSSHLAMWVRKSPRASKKGRSLSSSKYDLWECPSHASLSKLCRKQYIHEACRLACSY